ncbi:MAG: DUF433 domain-containing protein [Acidobacteriota bacterium]
MGNSNPHESRFPLVNHRLGAARQPTAVVGGTGIRVQTLVVAARDWGMSHQEIIDEYGLTAGQVAEALAYYEEHRAAIDSSIAADQKLEATET